jgi:FKBP-type peptidyl-prolyl cis-trans isomerase 2
LKFVGDSAPQEGLAIAIQHMRRSRVVKTIKDRLVVDFNQRSLKIG